MLIMWHKISATVIFMLTYLLPKTTLSTIWRWKRRTREHTTKSTSTFYRSVTYSQGIWGGHYRGQRKTRPAVVNWN